MASSKDIFEANVFEANIFAAGIWRGIGAAPQPPSVPGIEFTLPNNRCDFTLPDNRADFTLPDD